jgi:hypothetical protein
MAILEKIFEEHSHLVLAISRLGEGIRSLDRDLRRPSQESVETVLSSRLTYVDISFMSVCPKKKWYTQNCHLMQCL